MEKSPKQHRSFLKLIIISPDEPRLRAGWRLLLQTIILMFLFFCFLMPIAFVLNALPNSTWLLLSQISELFAITISVFLARRFLDRRSFASLGLKFSPRMLLDLMAGILITFLMMALIFLLEWAAGWLTLDGFSWQFDPMDSVIKETALIFAAFIFVSWNEELLSRGYHLQTLESGLNTFWAVLLSSLIFGIQHLINPNSESIWFVTAGIFLAGVFLSYGYLRTRQLWLSIGLHFGWNFFEGVVFGFPVSGLSIYRLTRITVDGPELWTGGPFGPEAGLVLVPGMILGFALIYIYTRGRLENQDNLADGIALTDDLILPE